MSRSVEQSVALSLDPPALPHSHGPTLRQSLRLVTFAWIFGAVWMHISTGAAMTRYAKLLDIGPFGFGLLAAMPFMGALFQLPASYLMERHGHRKQLFIIAGLIHRGMWLAIAAIPWLLPDAAWWWMLLIVMAASTVLANLMTPAWITWMADMVPERIRGRYFSRRGQYGRVVGIVATLTVAMAMDTAMIVGDEALRKVISIALAVSAVCGMLDIGVFKWVPDRREHRHDPGLDFAAMFAGPLRDRSFLLFLGYTATLTFAVGYVGQFIWLYLFDVVGMTNLQANMMLIAVPLLVQMLSFPIWGRLVDRLGCKPVLAISGLMIVHGGASWILVTQEQWWIGYMGSITATAAWPGVELASLNLLMGLSRSNPGVGSTRGSAYVAVHSMAVALAGMFSGLFAGTLARAMGDWKGDLLGIPLTYHGVLLLLSALLRLSALLWLIGLREPGAWSTRAAVRYMAANIYSNVQQAILFPTRSAMRFGRFTYRLLPRKGGIKRMYEMDNE